MVVREKVEPQKKFSILRTYKNALFAVTSLFYYKEATIHANHPQYDAYTTVEAIFFKSFRMQVRSFHIDMVEDDLNPYVVLLLLKQVDRLKIRYKFDSKLFKLKEVIK